MKHLKFLALLIAAVLILSSCKKSSSVPPASTPGLSFRMNGTLVKTDTVQTTLFTITKEIEMAGYYNNKNSDISFIIPHARVGSYDVVKDSISVTIDDNGTFYFANTGTVTITALSGTSMSGTFQFAGSTNTGPYQSGVFVTISEGQFTSTILNQ